MTNLRTIVHKFGGSCLRDASDVKQIANVLYQENQSRNIIVVSALWGTTDRLIRAANEPRYAGRLVSDLHSQHKRFSPTIQSSELGRKYDQVLRGMEKSLTALSKKPDDKVAYNRLLAAGERLSALVVANELNLLGLNAHPLGSEDIGICLAVKNGQCEVDIAKTKKSLQHDALFGHPVVTGWFGKGPNDDIALLSRGGSDHTAAALSVVLDADRVILWKDVEGLFPINPRWNIPTKPLRYIGYGEALEFAHRDAPILHVGSIEPLMTCGIPLEIRNISTFRETKFSTIIGPDIQSYNGLKGIACVQHVSLISLHTNNKDSHTMINLVKEIQDENVILFGLEIKNSTAQFISLSSCLQQVRMIAKSYHCLIEEETFTGMISCIGNGVSDIIENHHYFVNIPKEHQFKSEHGFHFLTKRVQLREVISNLKEIVDAQVMN